MGAAQFRACIGATTVSYLILSDSILRIEPLYQFYIAINIYYQLRISNHGDLI